MANVNRHSMMSYLQPNKQKPLMMNFNGGQSPMGGNRSSDVPMGPPSDLQNPDGWHPPMLTPYQKQERPNFPPNYIPPSWDQSPVDTWGRPDRQEGDPVNPQKQDGDGNWYEWDGHQWKPIMGPKPLIKPGGWHGLQGLQHLPGPLGLPFQDWDGISEEIKRQLYPFLQEGIKQPMMGG